MKLTVIVATRDRAADLARLLGSLHAMQLPTSRALEVLVVDNGSTDDTRAVVERSAPAAGAAQRYLFEARKGKSHALNLAVSAATGDVLAFVDDDIVVSPDWAERLWELFADPALDGVGGRVELYDPQDAPVTVRTSTAAAAVDLQTFTPTNIPILGCNMAFRAEIIRRVGPFDPNLGPGSPTVSEDLDFLYRVLRAGAVVRFAPELLVFHNHGRRAADELRRLRRGYVRGRGAFYYKHVRQGDERVKKWAYWEVRGCLLAAIRQPRLAQLKENAAVLADLAAGAVLFRRSQARAGP